MEKMITLQSLNPLMSWYSAWGKTPCVPGGPRSSSSLVLENENLIPWLDQQFVVRDYPGVLRLLRAHPLLQSLLWEAAERVAGVFGPVTMVLEVDIDPEGDVEPRLCLGIVTDLEPEQALENLDLFDAAWWLDAMQRTNDQLCITLEYA